MFRRPRRETITALRARRQAHQLASELLHPTVPSRALRCRHCGQIVQIDPRSRAADCCPACHDQLHPKPLKEQFPPPDALAAVEDESLRPPNVWFWLGMFVLLGGGLFLIYRIVHFGF